jgi:serine/threonine-protein kinase
MGRQLGPGSILGGYKLESEVGRGGMGVVYRAIQLNLDRPVAVKVFFFQEGDPGAAEYIERFFHEARAAAVLNHPNIVQIYDAGCSEGLYYYAMEFIEGETVLAQLRRSGGLGPRRTLQIAGDLIDALSYGWNGQHLVHGDIKPENILIDAHGRTKLMDFGLSHFSKGGAGDQASLILTPHYAAPELVTGRTRGTCATDIYALGATLYQILSGQTLFLGTDPQEIMRRQLSEEPLPLNVRAPAVPANIANFIGKMLIKAPEKRLSTWLAVRQELDQVLGAAGTVPENRTRIKVARPVASVKAGVAIPVARAVPKITDRQPRRMPLLIVILLLLGILAALLGTAWCYLKTPAGQAKAPDWLRPWLGISAPPAAAEPPPEPAAAEPPPATTAVFGQDPWKVPDPEPPKTGHPAPSPDVSDPPPPKEIDTPPPPGEVINPDPRPENGNPEPEKAGDRWKFADTLAQRRQDGWVRLLDQLQQADFFVRGQRTREGEYPSGISTGWNKEALKPCQAAIEQYLQDYPNDPAAAEVVKAQFLNKTILATGVFRFPQELRDRIIIGAPPPAIIGDRTLAELGWRLPFEMSVMRVDETSITVHCRRPRGRGGVDNQDVRIAWKSLPELPLLMLCDQVFGARPTPASMSLLLLSPSVDDQVWERAWMRVADKEQKKAWDQLRRDFREAPRQRGALDLLAEATRCHQNGDDRGALARLKPFLGGGTRGVPAALANGPLTETHQRYLPKVKLLIQELANVPGRPAPPLAVP